MASTVQLGEEPDPAPALGGRLPDVVRGRPLRHFRELVRELGGNAAMLLARAGLADIAEAPGDTALSYRGLGRVMELAAADLACPDFGLRLAGRQGSSALYGAVGMAMRSAPDLRAAMHCAAAYSHAHSAVDGVWIHARRTKGETLVGHDILVEGIANRTQVIEMILRLGQLVIADITDGRVALRRVHFRHDPVAPRSAYRRHFGCEVRFRQRADAIVLADTDLVRALPGRNPARFAQAVEATESRLAGQGLPLRAKVRGILSHFIPIGLCSRERVAAQLGLHPRTMIRHLAEEGATFQAIKDEVRRDFLHYYLTRTDLDLTQIAEALGFAEQSVVSRFSRKWFSSPPSRLRATSRG